MGKWTLWRNLNLSSNLKMGRNFIVRDKVTRKRLNTITLKRIVRHKSNFRF